MNGRTAVLTLCAFGILGLQDLTAATPQISTKDRADAGQAFRALQADRQEMASYVRSNPGNTKAGWDVSLLKRKTQDLADQARVIQRVAATAKSTRHGDLCAKILSQASALQQQLDAVARVGGRPSPKDLSAVESSLTAIEAASRELAIIEPDILR